VSGKGNKAAIKMTISQLVVNRVKRLHAVATPAKQIAAQSYPLKKIISQLTDNPC